jgi:hypothetical protein
VQICIAAGGTEPIDLPTTAYSKKYQRDVEHLLGLLYGTNPTDADPDTYREWIRADIQCSSCGRPGAQIPGRHDFHQHD